ncbi:hypothetical protein [Sinosporangium siamense]|uniref:Uncharacterized protein n=1 Tax=Sinosporangium siamense TaxID=1367973 RepID=A0A919RHU9_9ACTN|nr:hypothetical protein [Sinosporangium siamense]GII93908.1 hypothetical protein Ssi02_41390 [Sinosporangium siamense]
MTWILVGAGFSGLVVIAVAAVRVQAAVGALAKEIERSRAVLTPKRAHLGDEIRAAGSRTLPGE